MSMTEPAWVLMLEGRLSLPERAHGRVGSSGTQSEPVEWCATEAWPNVVTEADGEELPSLKGLESSFSCSSLTTSAGPKDRDARGDPTGGRDWREPSEVVGDSAPALMTSALTTRTLPLTGVMIMGASFMNSLAKLALDMYEFLEETPETPERWEGA
jgi:hypothetical protein